MITEKHTSTIEALKQATDKQQVMQIISGITNDDMAAQLQTWLEQQSPLEWDSTQWSSFRYALICLRGCPELQ
ncbi:hypothetical protein HHL17_29285 [Chitinophaga sp. G-6-1-13]|uniref:Uncharacterized protein n=1 Tax=Chitinophaga fulva TaxID=2728842 RepID=A0A848GXH3_9BACT|nr:hypothetical protein [Chitinophaga fulva]NML41323.1 hypothetical protein [Chitinophaga fulva]